MVIKRRTCGNLAFLVAFAVIVSGVIVISSNSKRVDSIDGVIGSDHGPLKDAVVRIKGTAVSTRTDDRGRFRLTKPDSSRLPLALTASKTGYFIGGESAVSDRDVEIVLERHPDMDFEGYVWVDPTPDGKSDGNCANCHAEIYEEWNSTAHATSASGFRLRNLYDGTDRNGDADRGWNLLAAHPDGAGVCISCHAPAAQPNELAVGDLRSVAGIARYGVHCDYCHKIQSVSLHDVGISHGRFAVDLLRPKEGQLFFGPLDDVDRGEDIHSPLQSRSEFCAACHQGIVFGVPVYQTYTEWLASPAAARGEQCQSCHMRPTGELHNFAPGTGGIQRDPMTLASHQMFPGGKAEFLKKCLELSTEIVRRDQALEARISILPRMIGHRGPTGFVDRHLILVVEARNALEQTVSISGPRLPSVAGSLAGNAGVLFAKRLIGENAEEPIPFWQPVLRVEDTRLQPEQEYRATFGLSDSTKTVRVRLIYRHFWEQVAIEKKWLDNEIVVHDRTLPVVPGDIINTTALGWNASAVIAGNH